MQNIIGGTTLAAVNRASAQIALEVFQREGFKMLAMPLHAAAVHEASHAVIYTTLERRVLSLHLFEKSQFRRRREREKEAKESGFNLRDDRVQSTIREILKLPEWCGLCDPKLTANDLAEYWPRDDPRRAERQVRSLVAGFMGERLLGNTSDALSLDEQLTAQLICRKAWGKNGEREWLRITGEVLAALKRFWPVVIDVAALLEQAPSKGYVQHCLCGPALETALARVVLELRRQPL
jgi:hypothetical protein